MSSNLIYSSRLLQFMYTKGHNKKRAAKRHSGRRGRGCYVAFTHEKKGIWLWGLAGIARIVDITHTRKTKRQTHTHAHTTSGTWRQTWRETCSWPTFALIFFVRPKECNAIFPTASDRFPFPLQFQFPLPFNLLLPSNSFTFNLFSIRLWQFPLWQFSAGTDCHCVVSVCIL